MTQPNEPAFSKAAFYHPDGGADSPQEGLTKREYFSAMAMQGIISNPNSHHVTSYSIAERAAQMADALIEQLNKQHD